MNLDCTTERGRTFIQFQDSAANRFAAIYGLEVRQTGAEAASDIDAMFYRDGRLTGIAEIKVRAMSLDKLQRFGTYLITFDKLVRCADLSRRLCCPFSLIVALQEDGQMMYWNITDATGRFVISNFDVRITTTQETCNGGSIERANAYLPVSCGKVVPSS